jgi:hypothetical protein
MDSDADLNVIQSPAQDAFSICEAANQCRPDVIVFDRQTSEANQRAISHLLIVQPRLQIIVISAETNWMQVFRKEDILMSEPLDLLNLIHTF